MFEIFDGISLGLGVATLPINLAFALVGCLLGTLIGVLPGLGPTATIAILLPITYGLPPETGLIALAGIYYGAQYGGSTTSILLRLPGESSSVVTALDGYEMTRKGRGGSALAIAALGSFFAGTVATIFIAVSAPILAIVVLKFGAPEYFMLMAVGLFASILLARGSVLRALIMIMVGLLIGMVGMDVNSGQYRYTAGFYELMEGAPFVPLVIGFFGIADILLSLERAVKSGEAVPQVGKISRLWPSREEMRYAAPASARGTVLGMLLGLLPGGGALLSSFVAYAAERKISKRGHLFGTGLPEAVAAPESANNAGAQTSFMPLLTLGLPSNAIMALMTGAMLMQGIVPGPQIMTNQPALFWGLIASMWIGNLMLLVINLPMVGVWVQVLKVKYQYLFPTIFVVSAIGVYGVNFTTFDLYLMVLAGFLGYLFAKWRCEPAPLILAVVLGPMMEEYFRRALLVGRGDFSIFINRPISLTLLIILVVMVVATAAPSINKFRNEAFVE